MVFGSNKSKPASGPNNPFSSHEPVNQKVCQLQTVQDLVSECENYERNKPDFTSETGDDSEDESPIRPPEVSHLKTPSVEDCIGNASAVLKSVSLDSATLSHPNKASLKSALSSKSTGRQGLRVQWAADVYDPAPRGSKKKGPKPALVSRRARRHQNSKAAHSKSKKHGKGDKATAKSAKESVEAAKEVVEEEDTNVNTALAGAGAAANMYTPSDNVDTENAGEVHSPVDVEEHLHVAEAPVQSSKSFAVNDQPAPFCISVKSEGKAAELEVSDGEKPSGSPKKSKKRNKRGRNTNGSADAAAGSVNKCESELEDAILQRLAGANALASGQTDAAMSLLLQALVAAKALKAVDEEARCLRLLADTQADVEKENSLISSAMCFGTMGLAYEHAEALLALAQHQVHHLLLKNSTHQGARFFCGSGMSDPAGGSALQSAKSHLQMAATALLGASSAASSTLIGGLKLDSPTGRRRKSKGQHFLSPEVSAATVVMGRICEVWGRVCLLLGEFDEAYAHFFAASSNSLWCKECPAEALKVGEFIDALSAKCVVAQNLSLPCAVY